MKRLRWLICGLFLLDGSVVLFDRYKYTQNGSGLDKKTLGLDTKDLSPTKKNLDFNIKYLYPNNKDSGFENKNLSSNKKALNLDAKYLNFNKKTLGLTIRSLGRLLITVSIRQGCPQN